MWVRRLYAVSAPFVRRLWVSSMYGTPFRNNYNNYNYKSVLITIKVRLEKCQKFIPINVMFIKKNFIVTVTLRDTMG